MPSENRERELPVPGPTSLRDIWKNHRYLFYPLLIFLIYFGLDKICLSSRLKMLSQPDAVYLYFDYKENLLDEMQEIQSRIRSGAPGYKNKKIFMMLGSSRLMFFSYEQFSRNFPDWELFNFSAPVTAPAYYDYLLERAYERGIRPDYVLLETDPYQYNEGSGVFVRSNLAHGFDFRFILEHANLFTNDEISYFLARNLFAGFKYPPHPGTVWERILNPMDNRLVWLQALDEHQRKNRGAGRSLIPRANWYERSFPRLEVIAERDIRRMYSRFRFDERQLEFTRNILTNARRHNTALIFLRPQISRPLEKRINDNKELVGHIREWERRVIPLIEKEGYPYIDMARRNDYYCNTFVDASHMSLDCYHPMLILVMRQYGNIRERMRAVGIPPRRGGRQRGR